MLWIAAAHAFTVQPRVRVGSDEITGLAAAAGDTVVVSGGKYNGFNQDLVAKTSVDRGLTFTSEVVVADLYRFRGFRSTSPGVRFPAALSSDASVRLVAGNLWMSDYRVPWIGAYDPVKWGALGVWRDDGAGWGPAHVVDAMTDRCATLGRGCMLLVEVTELAASDDGSVAWTTYLGDDHHGQVDPGHGRQVLLGRTEHGVVVGAPLDLSAAVLPNDLSNERDPQVATDITGDQVFVAFGSLGSPMGAGYVAGVTLAASVDGGATWTTNTVDGGGGDVAVARDTGEVLWAVANLVGGVSELQLRTSTDGGQTFGAPDILAVPQVYTDHLRLAVSRDGGTVAIAYSGDLFAGQANAGIAHVLVSEDAGATWTDLSLGLRCYDEFELAISDDGDTVYVLGANNGDAWLVRATR
ncbi:MAG: exo-alpha-sialidase [Alphaproteobacteria bacterium]|nr:exo-alpha-sialidase [Alphaproteobacteria bacterium]MCB9697753.1 exo-alpha-sialidase [Alphaproteobacteria bacterium]